MDFPQTFLLGLNRRADVVRIVSIMRYFIYHRLRRRRPCNQHKTISKTSLVIFPPRSNRHNESNFSTAVLRVIIIIFCGSNIFPAQTRTLSQVYAIEFNIREYRIQIVFFNSITSIQGYTILTSPVIITHPRIYYTHSFSILYKNIRHILKVGRIPQLNGIYLFSLLSVSDSSTLQRCRYLKTYKRRKKSIHSGVICCATKRGPLETAHRRMPGISPFAIHLFFFFLDTTVRKIFFEDQIPKH